MHTWIPAVLAVVAALLIAAGTVLRQKASAANGAITTGWWVGAVIAVVGFGFQAGALGLGSILLVQPLIVLAVLFALPLEAWVDHRMPSKTDWLWGGMLVGAVVLFLFLAQPVPSERRPSHVVLAATVTVLIVLLVGLVVIAEKCRSPHNTSLWYGIAAGALFGICALLVKSVSLYLIEDPWHIMEHADVYLLAITGVLAVVAQQKSFGAGELQTSFPAMNVMEPAVAMALGVILLGENLRVGVGRSILLVLILLVAAVAVVKLAQHSAVRSGILPDPTERKDPEPTAAG
ncbi:MAG: DMT family transporter [Gordonia sp. (in: high G+C Gram-positive bacteria)]|uniref:DMT family transporter n=1 Tax=Gordonia sp. (in: high G+C Gram-positive bacteria) TaxID=84139 RepID=UPI0039E694C1